MPVQALGDGIRDCRRHILGVEQNLVVVKSQHREATEGESRISAKVAATIGCLVMGKPVELNNEAVTDEAVQRMPVHPDLLGDCHSDAAHEVDEVCFDPRVG